MGVESNEKQNLENFSRNILEYKTGLQTDTAFLTFQAALEYVFKLAENERLILAIDEYPYVARSSKSLASTIQLLIDKYKENSRLMLYSADRPCHIWKIRSLHTKLPCMADGLRR